MRLVGSILTDQVGSFFSFQLSVWCKLKAELFHTGRLITGIDLTDKLSLETREEQFKGEKKE